MTRRKCLSKKGALVLLLVVLCSLAWVLLLQKNTGITAVVERNGTVLLRQSLHSLSSPVTYEFEGENNITVQVELSPAGAAVLSSQCPDQICVHTGQITHAGESAICLPARITLRLEGTADTDAYLH